MTDEKPRFRIDWGATQQLNSCVVDLEANHRDAMEYPRKKCESCKLYHSCPIIAVAIDWKRRMSSGEDETINEFVKQETDHSGGVN